MYRVSLLALVGISLLFNGKVAIVMDDTPNINSFKCGISHKDEVVWRYMNFAKFVSLLASKKMYFCRVDKLDDPFEGVTPQGIKSSRKEHLQGRAHLGYLVLMHMEKEDIRLRRNTYVNCWHRNQSESYAMWKIFLNNSEGIAIRTTCGNLNKSLPHEKNFRVHLGVVNYIDHRTEVLDQSHIPPSLFTLIKRKHFEYEQEIRALFIKGGKNKIPPDLERDGCGIYVPVNIETLIGEIYVAPNAPKWFNKVVNLVLEKYGINKEVVQSSLDDDPNRPLD